MNTGKLPSVNFRTVQGNYYDALTYNRKLNIKCADQYYEYTIM